MTTFSAAGATKRHRNSGETIIGTHLSPEVLQFIRANLPLAEVPLIPEIRLHKASPTSGLRRLAEIGGHGLGTPYWAYPWGGGLALARYILDHTDLVAGRRVLDLGAGSGLVGIAAAKAGARAVIAADTDPRAMIATHLNAAANGVDVSTLVHDMLDGAPPAVDIVLAADLFYEQRLAQRVTGFLRRCFAAQIGVLIGDPYRPFLPRSELRIVTEYSVPDFGLGSTPTPSAVFRLKGIRR